MTHYFKTTTYGIKQVLISFYKQRMKFRFVILTCLKGIKLIFFIPSHRKVINALSFPNLNPLTTRHPSLIIKHLRKYLSLNFSTKTRTMILINHYNFLNSHLTHNFYQQIIENHIILWKDEKESTDYKITITFPNEFDREGDLSLTFTANNSPLFVLSFTIIPSKVIGISENQTLMISRLQGVKGNGALIKEAAKTFSDNSLATILLAATQGIALSLNIKNIVGINAKNQISYSSANKKLFLTNYDEFWLAHGATRLSNKMFYLPIPLPEKSLNFIQRNHRRRTKRKRMVKHQITNQVYKTFQENLLKSI